MENGKEYPLPSGATLFVSVSAYEQIMALHDALGREMRGQGLGALDVAKISKAFEAARQARLTALAGGAPAPAEPDDGDDGLNIIVDRVLAVATSKEFRTALFACAEKAVYRPDGSEASSLQFKSGTPGYGVFDNPSCREQALGDYYDICKAIAEENLRPFGKALISMFTALVGKRAVGPELNTVKA